MYIDTYIYKTSILDAQSTFKGSERCEDHCITTIKENPGAAPGPAPGESTIHGAPRNIVSSLP